MEALTNKLWRSYYDHHKALWYDSSISIYVKSIVRLVELHRSDSMGWSISIRNIAKLLGITLGTALKYTNQALKLGYIESTSNQQRKRRKLKLSASLRIPVECKKYDYPLYHKNNQYASFSETQSDSSTSTVNSNINNKGNNKFHYIVAEKLAEEPLYDPNSQGYQLLKEKARFLLKTSKTKNDSRK